MVTALATHYARALADAVTSPQSDVTPEEAAADLRVVAAVLEGSPDLQRCLLSPAISREKKGAIAEILAKQFNLHRLVRNFLHVVVRHRRVTDLRGVILEFERIIDERTGFERADIVSAAALTGAQEQEIIAALEKTSGKRIRAHFKTDPSLLGGVIARLHSIEFDGSLLGGLNALRHQLRTAS
jgi:F-type H+-transporting ATPase subunit delta